MLLLVLSSALAATFNVPSTYSLTEAVNLASDGDTIFINGSADAEQVTITKDLTIQGQSQNDSAIRGYAPDIFLFDVDGATVVLNDLTINGHSSRDGVVVSNGGTLQVSNVRFWRTKDGISASQSATVTVADSLFEDNESGIHSSSSSVTVDRSQFFANTNRGIWSSTGDYLVVRDSWFEGNSASSGGGVLFTDGELLGNVFCQNSVTGRGGAVTQTIGSIAEMRGNIFFFNEQTLAGSGSIYGGGAVYATGTLQSINNTYVGNSAANTGGVLHAAYDGFITSRNDLFIDTVTVNPYNVVDVDDVVDPGVIGVELGWFFNNAGGRDLGPPPDVSSFLSTFGQDPMLTGSGAGCNPDDMVPKQGSPLVDAGTGDDDADGSDPDIGAFGGPYPNPWLDKDDDGVRFFLDCDDDDPTRFPGNTEVAGDFTDNDCDGLEICFIDDDEDGEGGTDTFLFSSWSCSFDGLSVENTDCNDGDPSVYTDAPETVADGIDQDCDFVDSCYEDSDGDGQGSTVVIDGLDLTCANDGESKVDTDCDDIDSPDIYLMAPETVGDGIDQDCDDNDDCYADTDGDGQGSDTVITGADLTCANNGESKVDTDCNDNNAPTIYLNAPETVADGIDQDCDLKDDCYEDSDGDGQGSDVVITGADLTCANNGESKVDTDCDDINSPDIYLNAPETVADGIDQDCDQRDDCYQDIDGDDLGSTVVILGTDLTCTRSGEAKVATDCDDNDGNVDDTVAWWPDTDGDQQGDEDASPDNDDCDPPGSGDWVEDASDCDDNEPTTYDGAPETTADGVDQNCDDRDVCYVDGDLDGFGTTSTLIGQDLSCTNNGESTVDTDCDDNDPDQFPGQEWFVDGDGDDFGAGSATVSCTPPGNNYVVEDGDCDDNDANVGALRDWYADGDNDGYVGDTSGTPINQCTSPGAGYAYVLGDCDDNDEDINPGATELPADDVDQNCDDTELCYEDFDGDTYGTTITIYGSLACDESGESSVSTDCDDTNNGAGINPDAEETCDGVDEDCSGVADDNVSNPTVWTIDGDGDGYGDEDASATVTQCDQPTGYVLDATDCDDGDGLTYPDAPELCDNLDNDCDGQAEQPGTVPDKDWYPDGDGDGFGDESASPVADCAQPSGHVLDATDCDDGDATVNPAASEIPGNLVDEDCDGVADSPSTDTGLDTDTPFDTDTDGPGDTGEADTDTDTDSDTDADTDSDTDADTTSDDDEKKKKCGCEVVSGGAAALWLLPMVAVAMRRRR